MPTLMPGFQQDWNSDGVPGNIMVLGQGGTLFIYDRIVDTTTGIRYICANPGIFDNVDTYTGCEFVLDVDESNINSVLYKAQGDITLSLGSATVSCNILESGDQIQICYKSPAGTPGSVFVTSVNPGTGFTLGSTSLLDASTINWKVLN